METVFTLIGSFPTVVYTIPLGICLVFWLFSLLGVFDVIEVDIDSETGLAGLMATFGLAGVPITLSFSLLFLFAWSLSLCSDAWLLSLLPAGMLHHLAGVAVLILSLVLAVYLTGKITRPLSKLFVTHEARSNRSLLAKSCQITSMSVDENFGQAKVEDGGAGLIISVRATTPNDFTQGDSALIYDYDADKNLYFISKLD
ncbi:hypothetical protein NP590_07895 [Methylomonas sp. SURF-2]|uniref:Ubiquinone biosynthesis protein UbiH n=1 Tax=Methylomonas subterranea TaxID=2952225 RepID=A0ABT1TEX7_9GAMM|nr:hypothetical protein [Methylomonas sp. SURF-2]MCQ8104022.1 hypothetical protein [Methylomonas sp. SURF-2]